MQKLVEFNGGRFEGVGLRVTLVWSNCNDLDLHVVEPDGEEVNWDTN